MFTPFFRHWSWGGGVPLTETVNVTSGPKHSVVSCGCTVNTGAWCTARMAGAEVAAPHSLVATQS